MSKQFWEDFQKKNSITQEQLRNAMANYKPKKQSDDGYFTRGAKSFAQGFLMPASSTAKGLDQIAKAMERNTGLKSGGFFGNLGNTFEEWANELDEGNPHSYAGKELSDRLSWEWLTNPYGAASEIPNAIGNAAFFLAPTGRANALNIGGRALGVGANVARNAGASKVANALASPGAKDFQ